MGYDLNNNENQNNNENENVVREQCILLFLINLSKTPRVRSRPTNFTF